MSKSSIVNFLEGKGSHPRYGIVDQILMRDDSFWERNHDFIQWLFPLDEASRSVRNAPVLTHECVASIRLSDEAKKSFLKATKRYKEFLARSQKWRTGYDHNQLRISRVIKSLRLLISDEAANSFKYWVAGELGDNIDKIHPDARKHWRLA